jgi:hypothetical protein
MKEHKVPRWVVRTNGLLRHIGLGIAVILVPRRQPRVPYRLCRVRTELRDLEIGR